MGIELRGQPAEVCIGIVITKPDGQQHQATLLGVVNGKEEAAKQSIDDTEGEITNGNES